MMFIYTTCRNVREAERIGRHLVEKRLAACSVVLPYALSLYQWPEGSGTVKKGKEAVLIVKTLSKKKQLNIFTTERMISQNSSCGL